jgi:hypothetical protein
MSTQIGKAIFNLQRFQILQAKLNPATEDLIPDNYAYAWQQRMFPVNEESDIHFDLAEYFEVSKEQVDEITAYADEEWRKGNLYTFYQYESHFKVRVQGKTGIDRHALIAVFRYFFLNDSFDQPFWDRLLAPMEYPTEAERITREFSIDELYLVI